MRKGKIKNITRPDDFDRSLARLSPRFCALRVRRPPQLRGRPVEQPGGGAEGSPDVSDLGPLGEAAVGVHGGHLRSVAAVLAEPAEARRVQDARAHAEPLQRAVPHHPVQHVLLLHARRSVPRCMPLVEQRHRPVVGGHEEEARVQLVAGVVVRLAVEIVAADQEVLVGAAVQHRERVPQPHHVQILTNQHKKPPKNLSMLVVINKAEQAFACSVARSAYTEDEAVAVLEDVAEEPDTAPHHAYEPIRHVQLLRREVAGAVHQL
jgi:hypothetical protein